MYEAVWSPAILYTWSGFECWSQFKLVLLDVKCNPTSVNLQCTTKLVIKDVHVCSYMYTGVFLPNSKDSIRISIPHSAGSMGTMYLQQVCVSMSEWVQQQAEYVSAPVVCLRCLPVCLRCLPMFLQCLPMFSQNLSRFFPMSHLCSSMFPVSHCVLRCLGCVLRCLSVCCCVSVCAAVTHCVCICC